MPACRLSGSDIDPEAIAWAQRHLAHVGTFSVNDPSPPTRFTDASFDVPEQLRGRVARVTISPERTWSPAEHGTKDDLRTLGVSVRKIASP